MQFIVYAKKQKMYLNIVSEIYAHKWNYKDIENI